MDAKAERLNLLGLASILSYIVDLYLLRCYVGNLPLVYNIIHADLNSAFRHVHNNKLLISISFTHDINYNSLHINPPK